MREAKVDPGQYGTDGTVFALATAPGRAAIAVVRVSGPAADSALVRLAGAPPPPRMMALRLLRAGDGTPIDRALVVRFPQGASYTGEAMVELHVHGGLATVARVMAELAASPELRPAAPGEFTRRALHAGRMDLTEVEGLADLIDAETEMQRRHAIAALEGGLSARARRWRAAILEALADLEATLDFSDEADAPDETPAGLGVALERIAADMVAAAEGAQVRERVRDGFRVALVGPPNSGKSTLINAIAGAEVAIAAASPGTTRDVIRVACDLQGLPVHFLDMAGIRETDDDVEALGISRARREADAADLRLLLTAPDAADFDHRGFERPGDIRVWAKADLGPGPGVREVSARTGDGLRELLDAVRAALLSRAPASVAAANRRQASCLSAAARSVRAAAAGGPAEIRAEELRRAADALRLLVGAIAPDDVLDGVFRRFCIGK